MRAHVALIGLLAACTNGSGDTPAPAAPPASAILTDVWVGTWESELGISGELQIGLIHEAGGILRGELEWGGDQCAIAKTSLQGTIREDLVGVGAGGLTLGGELSADNRVISGTYRAGFDSPCFGDKGTWSVRRVEMAFVEDLSGTWRGMWQSSVDAGTIRATVQQEVEGDLAAQIVANSPCLILLATKATRGVVSRNTVSLAFQFQSGTLIVFRGLVYPDGDMSGIYGVSGPCGGEAGSWSLVRD